MLGERKGSGQSAALMIQVGLYLFLVSAVAIGLWWLRADTIPTYEDRLERVQLLSRREQARGSQDVRPYKEGDWLRVRDFAVARASNDKWIGIEQDTVLVVRAPERADQQKNWLVASDLGRPMASPMLIHASFVERYDPLILERGLELSNCRVRRYLRSGGEYYSVVGELRNGTDRRISRCEVVCSMQSATGQPAVKTRSPDVNIEVGAFAEFETPQAKQEGALDAFSLRVRYETGGQLEETSAVSVGLRASQGAQRGRSAD